MKLSSPRTHLSANPDVYSCYLKKMDGDSPRRIQTLSSSIKTTNYHSRAYLFRKYASVL